MVDVCAAFPAGGEASVLVEEGEGLFDDPPDGGDVVAGVSAGDVGGDVAPVEFGAGGGVVVSLVSLHPQIHRIPIETRFIIDPGGLRDLADALTIRYDPYVGDDALRRLSDILTVRLVGRRDRDRGHTVPEAIGERHYWDAVGRLWSELVASTFDESVPAAGFGHADWPAGPFEPQSYRRAVPRYFSDRRE